MMRFTLHDGVGRAWFDRAERHNAFDGAMLQGLRDALDRWEADDACRVVVLGANGPSFCAGADLKWMAEQGQLGPEVNRRNAIDLGETFQRLAAFPKPVLARIQGAARGGGVGFAAAVDVAVAVERATFALTEVRLGLVPAVISPFIVERLGPSQARALFLTGDAVSATEALRLGLVHHVVADEAALDAKIDALVASLRLGGPEALSACKRLVAQVAFRPAEAMLGATADVLAQRRASAEAAEGMAAFVQKRPAEWTRTKT